jgi:putative hydrolase of the HAD superfamily
MPLLLLDLDNTLVDRDRAFREAVPTFLPGADLAWIMSVDNHGYTPRDEVAAAIGERYGASVSRAAIRALLDDGASGNVVLEAPARQALTVARDRGWTSVIVTNGRTVQQERKIRRTGLDRLVRGWIVSEAIGVKKPAPEIFEAAADLAGLPLAGAWVIGDSPHADIGGAVALGLRSVWVPNHESWPLDDYRPTDTAADVASAIHRVVGQVLGDPGSG